MQNVSRDVVREIYFSSNLRLTLVGPRTVTPKVLSIIALFRTSPTELDAIPEETSNTSKKSANKLPAFRENTWLPRKLFLWDEALYTASILDSISSVFSLNFTELESAKSGVYGSSMRNNPRKISPVLHTVSFPTYPNLHSHAYPPIVFEHVECGLQTSSLHSSTSEHNCPFPKKPLLHSQRYDPAVFEHVACNEQLKFPASHSSISLQSEPFLLYPDWQMHE